MTREKQYLAVKALIEGDHFEKFKDLFPVHSKKSNLARYLGTNNDRIERLINRPRRMTIEEIERVAAYYDVSFEVMLSLIRK